MSPSWPRHGLYAITPDEVDTPRLLARVDTFLAQARSSQALMVNAMHWFKHSLSPEMFKDGRG